MDTRQRSLPWVVAAVAVFALTKLAFAPPGPGPAGPRPNRPAGPKPAVARPDRPGPEPRPGVHKPLPARSPLRFIRHRGWWDGENVGGPTLRVWRDLEYPYYAGGTDYVVVTPPVRSLAGPVSTTLPAEAAGGEEYSQLLELVDMVHEWRTINESARVHERLQTASAEQREALRAANGEFDQASRSALQALVSDRPVEVSLTTARASLERLIQAVESLGPDKGTALKAQTRRP